MTDYTNESNYKEFVAVLADCMEATLGPVPGWRERIAAKYGDVDEFARVMTGEIMTYRGANDGPAVKATCKRLKIRNTYQAIIGYLTGTFPGSACHE